MKLELIIIFVSMFMIVMIPLLVIIGNQYIIESGPDYQPYSDCDDLRIVYNGTEIDRNITLCNNANTIVNFAIHNRIWPIIESVPDYQPYSDFCEEHNLSYMWRDGGPTCFRTWGDNIIFIPLERVNYTWKFIVDVNGVTDAIRENK